MSIRQSLRQLRAGAAATALAVGLAFAPSFAHATLITGTSTLSYANTILGGSIIGQTGTFGSMYISLDNSTGAATFTFTGANGYEFVDSNVADLNLSSSNFTFSTTANPTSPGGVTLASTGSGTVDGFGTFTETTSIGTASNPQTSISYTLTSPDFFGLTSIQQLLVVNGSGWDAAAHMCDSNGGCAAGQTGFVAESGSSGGSNVPEPGTLSIFAVGLLGTMGYSLARSRAQQRQLASI